LKKSPFPARGYSLAAITVVKVWQLKLASKTVYGDLLSVTMLNGI